MISRDTARPMISGDGKVAKKLFVTLVALGAIGQLSGCGQEQSAATGDAGATVAAPAFTTKVDGPFEPGVNPVLNLEVALNHSERDGKLVEIAGDAVSKIGQDIIAGKAPVKGDFSTINFTFRAPEPGPDPLVERKVLHLTYDAQSLRRLAHDGIKGDVLLSYADSAGWWTPANDDVVESYCTDNAGSQFCQKFVSGAGQGK